jgi:putative protease
MPGPELLAPAGDWEALVAAVQNGADAVYLGATAFNARQGAANFEPRELARAVDYAHVRDVKVYATVNVLVADQEVEAAARLLGDLYNAGVDAVIVQDLGLVRLIRDLLPDLEVHASTQATAHNLPTLQMLKRLGVRRVVLARELSLPEIAHLRRESGLAVEVFVHGALCVSYSGQCLFSSLVGGRSGNRGRCAQPCSLPYTLYRDGTVLDGVPGPYLLRPRDLNLSAHLPELVRAGVDALKIEGRMRRPEYVATVVRIYRRLLDRLAAGHFTVTAEEQRALAQVFNRGYTTGYLFGPPGRALMAYSRPNNRGLAVGRVRRFVPGDGTAEIALEAPLYTGDKIEVWVSVGGRIAATVREMHLAGRPVEAAAPGMVVALPLPGRVKPGDRVFKTEDVVLNRRARETFASPRERKSIPLTFKVTVGVGKPLVLEVSAPGGFAAKAVGTVPAVPAERRPLTEATLKEQLGRLGNTPFGLERLDCRIEGAVMLPLRELNEVRRRALEQLVQAKAAAHRPPALDRQSYERRVHNLLSWRPKAHPSLADRRPRLAVAVGDLAGVAAAVESGAEVVYFPGEGLGLPRAVTPRDLAQAGAVCRRAGASLVFWLPRILHDRDLEHWGRLLEESGRFADGVLVGNLGALLKAGEKRTELVADFPLNTFNRLTLSLLAELGAGRVTLSPELTLEQVREMTAGAPVPVEVLVHGALPVMVSAYCAVGSLLGTGDRGPCGVRCRAGRFAIRDRLGLFFPVGVDTACRMHIFNAKDLCAVEQIPALVRCGVSVFRVEARLRDAAYIRAVVEIYREVIDRTLSRGTDWRIPGEYKERLRALSPQGLTSGHFFRGVLGP